MDIFAYVVVQGGTTKYELESLTLEEGGITHLKSRSIFILFKFTAFKLKKTYLFCSSCPLFPF